MALDPVVASLVEASERVRRVVNRIWDELEREHGVTPTHAQVLDAIAGGHRQVSAVAEACGRHVSSASRLVDTLVTGGLVSRVEDPDDRRAVRLTLTAEGRRTARRIRAARASFLTGMATRMSAAELTELTRALQRFAEAAETSLGAACDGR